MVDVAALQKYSLFGALLPEDIDRLRPFMQNVDYAVGEEIIREGEPNGRLHFVLEGRVEVLKRDQELLELGEGETFGEVEVLDPKPAVASIKALVPTRVAIISNSALHEIYKADPRIFAIIIMNLARDIARRLRRMDEMACGAPPSPVSPRPQG